ncbi:MAG: alanine:cation symporter family protein [Culturomica sp.]|nr:alanine:cation symporter family protein [Culturomica sp.]
MTFSEIISSISSVLMGYPLVVLCLGAGLFFSIKTRFLQLRYFKRMFKLLFSGKSSRYGISSFQAFMLALAGRVGTGNIAGVATAIALGGPGSVFWMWITAFLGASTAYIESSLGQVYKEKIGGHFRGGPAFYILKGLKCRWFAVVFALSTIIAEGILTPGVQSNGVAYSFQHAFGVDLWVTSLIVGLLIALVIFGGIKRIARVAEFITPFMAFLYVVVACIIITVNYSMFADVFSLILKSAFGLEPALGGIAGAAIAMGVKRGIYSNEAGQGSAVHAAAAANVSHPAKQGLVQAFSVYVDTLLVCSATAFIILSTGMYNVFGSDGSIVYAGGNIPADIVEHGPIYTQLGVDSILPGFGAPFVAIVLSMFAFTTLISYYFQAESNIYFLFRDGKKAKYMLFILKISFIVIMFFTSIAEMQLAWDIADIGVGLMAWTNIIAIILLQKIAMKTFYSYEKQLKKGIKEPVFNPHEAGIKEETVWDNMMPKS